MIQTLSGKFIIAANFGQRGLARSGSPIALCRTPRPWISFFDRLLEPVRGQIDFTAADMEECQASRCSICLAGAQLLDYLSSQIWLAQANQQPRVKRQHWLSTRAPENTPFRRGEALRQTFGARRRGQLASRRPAKIWIQIHGLTADAPQPPHICPPHRGTSPGRLGTGGGAGLPERRVRFAPLLPSAGPILEGKTTRTQRDTAATAESSAVASVNRRSASFQS